MWSIIPVGLPSNKRCSFTTRPLFFGRWVSTYPLDAMYQAAGHDSTKETSLRSIRNFPFATVTMQTDGKVSWSLTVHVVTSVAPCYAATVARSVGRIEAAVFVIVLARVLRLASHDLLTIPSSRTVVNRTLKKFLKLFLLPGSAEIRIAGRSSLFGEPLDLPVGKQQVVPDPFSGLD